MKTKIIYSGLFALLVSGLLFISCSKSNSYNPGNNSPSSATVSIKNMAFNPISLSITTGTTVTWVNNDTTAHTVTANDGSFNSGTITAGSKFTQSFSTTGTFAYHCTLHPEMTGTIVVAKMPAGGY